MKKIVLGFAVLAVATAMCSCGSGSPVTAGNKSQTDTLSYALGMNIGYGMSYEFRDVPFEVEAISEALKTAALGKPKMTHEEALNQLRDYFMFKRGSRARDIAEKRAQADSMRLAAGDTVKVEYPLADPEMFESEQERHDVSYAFGNDIGYNIKESGLPIQVYWLDLGLTEALAGNAPMTDEEVNAYLQNYFMNVRPALNDEESKKWLAEVETKWGVHKTESGLLYKVVKKGDQSLKASDDRDIVVVRYSGTTRDGKVFDSTYDRVKEIKAEIEKVKKNKELSDEQREKQLLRLDEHLERSETAEFALNRVIKGWTEGMKLVGKGGKVVLWIPSELAYGEYGAGRNVGPNEALKFEVELVDVKPFVDPAAAEPAAGEEE